MKQIFGSFFRVSTLFMLGMPLTLLVNIVLARSLSVSDFGVYSFAIAAATIFSIPVAGGFPLLLTREVSGYSQNKDWPRYLGIITGAHIWVLVISAIVIFLLYAGVIVFGFDGEKLTIRALKISILLLPLLGLSSIRQGILKGLGLPVLSEMPNQLLMPVLVLAGLFVLDQSGRFSVEAALYLYVLAAALMFVVATLILLWVQPVRRSEASPLFDELKRWAVSLLPFAMLGAIGTVGAHLATMLLGIMGQEEAVATIRVAERGALFVILPLLLFNTVIGPHLVRCIREGSKAELKQLVRKSARLTTAIAAVLAFILIVFGRPLIGWTFGEYYSANAYVPMVILIAAQISTVSMGPSGLVLAMAGYEKYNVYGQIMGLVVMALLILMLAGPYGTLGGAIGLATGLFTTNFYFFLTVQKKMSIWPGIL